MTCRPILAASAILVLAACQQQPAAEPDGRDLSPSEVASELAAVQIEPGLWETRSEIQSFDAPGVPAEVLKGMSGRTTEAQNCITPEQAARPDANFLAAQRDSDCTYQDFSMRGGRMSGTMTCSGREGGEMVMRMDGQYGPRSYDIRMNMDSPGEGGMKIEARVTGRRVGDCPG